MSDERQADARSMLYDKILKQNDAILKQNDTILKLVAMSEANDRGIAHVSTGELPASQPLAESTEVDNLTRHPQGRVDQSPTASLPRSNDAAPHAHRRSKQAALEDLAEVLNLDKNLLQSSLNPTLTAPYIRPNASNHSWFKDHLKTRGSRSIPLINAYSTLLILWSQSANLGPVTVLAIKAVLKAINDRDKAAPRGLLNCKFLEVKGDSARLKDDRSYFNQAVVVIKPDAQSFDKAVKVARAICTCRPIEG